MGAFLVQEKELEKRPQAGEELGAYCKRLRGKRSQPEVARQAGLDVSSLKRIEGGESKRLKRKTKMGLAIALGVPEEWIQAAVTGEPVRENTSIKICPNCWVPGTPPDEAWGLGRARYCCMCAAELSDSCTNCGEPIEKWSDKFCRQCGHSLGKVG